MKNKTIRGFSIGFAIGVLFSVVYLLLRPQVIYFEPEPLWAFIMELALYPGFFVGLRAYDAFHLSEDICKVAGVLTVGIVYGSFGLLGRALYRKWVLYCGSSAMTGSSLN